MDYNQWYQSVLDVVDGDIEWMEMQGYVHPKDLVDEGGDDPLPPAAITDWQDWVVALS